MSAYYNEHDPFAAAWLRALITDGLIADGEVDERDIQTLDPRDLRGFTQCHFFAGIGGWSYALRLAGWPDDRPVWTGSCPCQPFSAAGAQAGGTDPRHLWPAWYQLIRECRPRVVFGEQVESAVAHGWLDLVSDDLEREGYAIGAVGLPAASVGAPHIRQRLWFVAEGVDNAVRGRRQHEPSERCVDGAIRATGQAECLSGAGSEADPVFMAESHHARHARTGQEPLHGEWHRQGAQSGVDGCGDAGELADAQRGATERRRHDVGSTAGSPEGPTHERQRLRDDVGTGQLIEQLGHADQSRPQGRRERPDEHADQQSVGATGESSGAGNAGMSGTARQRTDSGTPKGADDLSKHSGSGRPKPWDDLLWLPCRDGKARPTQSGLFPLAHGISNRVGILRGAGNAIVPQVAAAFIDAYLGVTA